MTGRGAKVAEGHPGRLGPQAFQYLNRHIHKHQLASSLASLILEFIPTSLLGCIRYGKVTCATPGIQESPENPTPALF